jgi:hypothetical protein
MPSMPEGVERIVLIINLDGWTIRNADLKGYLALLEIVQVQLLIFHES